MKRIATFLLAIMFVVSMAPTAFAESTTLTTTVPSATYTLNIPADQEIEYGTTDTNIGNITVTDGENFALGKNVEVTITYPPFESANTTTKIPYMIKGRGRYNDTTYVGKDLESGSSIVFKGKSDGTVSELATFTHTFVPGGTYTVPVENINVIVESVNWGKAAAGDYASIITFTSEIVVE